MKMEQANNSRVITLTLSWHGRSERPRCGSCGVGGKLPPESSTSFEIGRTACYVHLVEGESSSTVGCESIKFYVLQSVQSMNPRAGSDPICM
jgi:hypothetical protein